MMYWLTYDHALVKTLALYQLMDGGTDRWMETKEKRMEKRGRNDGWRWCWKQWDAVIDGKRRRSEGNSRWRGKDSAGGTPCVLVGCCVLRLVWSVKGLCVRVCVCVCVSVFKGEEGAGHVFYLKINHSLIHSRSNKNSSHLSLAHLSLSAPLSPLLCRLLYFDKGLKNEVKRWHSLQPKEHLARWQGRPAVGRDRLFFLHLMQFACSSRSHVGGALEIYKNGNPWNK